MRRPEIKKRHIDRLDQALRGGSPISAAAGYASIGNATYYEWRNRGKTIIDQLENGDRDPATLTTTEQLYIELVERTDEARAACEVGMAAQIVKHSATDWRAAAWWLERRSHNREWSKTDHVEITTPQRPALDAAPRDEEDHVANVFAALEAAGVIIPGLPAPIDVDVIEEA